MFIFYESPKFGELCRFSWHHVDQLVFPKPSPYAKIELEFFWALFWDGWPEGLMSMWIWDRGVLSLFSTMIIELRVTCRSWISNVLDW